MRRKMSTVVVVVLVMSLLCLSAIFKNNRRKVAPQPFDPEVQEDDKNVTVSDKITTSVPYFPVHSFSLIIGYSRGASEWIQGVVSYAEECFYIPNYLSSRISNEDEMGIYMSIYNDLFTCNFTSIHSQLKQFIVQAIVKLYTDRSTLKYCSNAHAWNSTKCLQEVKQICILKTHICIMTTHLPMKIVSEMFDLWNNLKVVHVVEEPYAILFTGLKDKSLAKEFNVQHHSTNLCASMYDDIKNTRLLQIKYPQRIKLLSLEAVKNSPFSAVGHIYEFLGLFLYTENVWFWVYSNVQNMIKRDIHENSQSTFTGCDFQCTKHLTYEMIQAIYLSCNDVYHFISNVYNLTKVLLSEKMSFMGNAFINTK